MTYTPTKIHNLEGMSEKWMASRGYTPLHLGKWREVAKVSSTEWRESCRKVYGVMKDGGIAALLGRRGVGKTQMAVHVTLGVMHDLWISGYMAADRKTRSPCRYVVAADLFVNIRSSFKDGGPSEREVMNQYTDPAILVIDEIHERGHTPFEDARLTTIIDARYYSKRPTLLIGNLTEEQYAAQLGPSIASRTEENGGAVVVEGPSHR